MRFRVAFAIFNRRRVIKNSIVYRIAIEEKNCSGNDILRNRTSLPMAAAKK